MDDKKTFGKRIKQLRKEKGYSIKNLANSLDVNYTYLSKIENDKSIPSEEFIEKISKIFSQDAEVLKLRAGKIPENIKSVLMENPQEILKLIRGKFYVPSK